MFLSSRRILISITQWWKSRWLNIGYNHGQVKFQIWSICTKVNPIKIMFLLVVWNREICQRMKWHTRLANFLTFLQRKLWSTLMILSNTSSRIKQINRSKRIYSCWIISYWVEKQQQLINFFISYILFT